MLPHDEVKRALEKLKRITVFSHDYNEEGKQINLLFRVGDAGSQRDGLIQEFWLEVVDAILSEEERLSEVGSPPWNVHICKHYIRHNGRLRFGWNMTIQANTEMRAATDDICRLLTIMSRHVVPKRAREPSPPTPASDPQPPVRERRRGSGGKMQGGEVVEAPLVGVTADRNAPQAPVWTPGGGGGRRGGRSSKGAHLIGDRR